MKKNKKWKKILVIVIVLAVIIGFFAWSAGRKDPMAGYNEVTAETRDITTYLEFTGNIEAVDVVNVYPDTAGKILEVLVEEGDEVKAGDVIALLDSGDVEYNIQLKEASLKLTKRTNDYNIKDSQNSLDNMSEQINSGLNSSINSAEKALLNAQKSYMDAAEAYNEAQVNYEKDDTSAIASAKQQVRTAEASYNNAYSQWEDHMMTDEMLTTYAVSLSNANESLKRARADAKKAVEDAYEALVKAETSLQDAEKDYETTVLSVSQNLETTQNALEKTQALTSTETSEMELEHLKESLADYTVYATLDGCVTSLNAKTGEYTATASPVAQITNFDTMQVSVKIDEYDIAQVQEGDPVEIYINALDKYYEGKIASISKVATIQNDVSYLEAIVEFEADEAIRSGFSAEVKLIKSDEKGVIALPVSAIEYNADNTAYVRVMDEEGNMQQKSVSLGVSDGTWVQITEGVTSGDVVYEQPSMEELYMQMMMRGSGTTRN